MRKFIDIVTEGKSVNSNRIEIVLSESIELLMDSFKNPDKELKLDFRVVHNDTSMGKVYMEAMVTELSSHQPLIKLDYTLGDDNLVISNIISFRDDKAMYTSSGQQTGATDMGYTAMKWLYKSILLDAKNRGFNSVKITSSTRYSGARAKNGTQTSIYDIPVNYNVDQKITERVVFTLEDGIIFVD